MTTYIVLAQWPGENRITTVLGSFNLPQNGYLDALMESQFKLRDMIQEAVGPEEEVTLLSGGVVKINNGITFFVDSFVKHSLEEMIQRPCRFRSKQKSSPYG